MKFVNSNPDYCHFLILGGRGVKRAKLNIAQKQYRWHEELRPAQQHSSPLFQSVAAISHCYFILFSLFHPREGHSGKEDVKSGLGRAQLS